MRKIVFATNNIHKLSEIRDILGPEFEIVSLAELGCHDDIPETADTLDGNALQKVRYVKEHFGVDCFADDTGLEVEALNGAPGVFTARFGAMNGYGDSHDAEANTRCLLDKLKGKENRRAQFRTAIALTLDGKEHLFEGIVKGDISKEKRGTEGFGYDPVFQPEEFGGKTFAEVGTEQKNQISHRARAVKKLAEFLCKTMMLLLFFVQSAQAENIGSWKIYACYDSISAIAPAGNDIYVVASGNLYSYNIENSIQTYDKTNFLNGSGITHIAWVQKAKKLVITYSDSNIDLLSSGLDVENLNALKEKQTTDDKTINDIYVTDKYAYLSTGFGIMKVDASDAYVANTYRLDFNVNYCYTDDSYIYAASEQKGLYRALLSSNLLDKNNWERVGEYTPKTKETYVQDTHNNCYWAQGEDSKLTQYKKQEDGTFVHTGVSAKPDGPIKNSFWRLYKHDGLVFCTPGIVAAGMTSKDVGCVQYYDPSASVWTELKKPSDTLLGTQYRSMNCMSFDPNDKNHFWVGGRSGLYEYKDYVAVNAFNSTNSTLNPMYNKDTSCALICSMAYDDSHNLWVGNGWCDVALHCLQNGSTWKSFPVEGYNYDNGKTIDAQGMMFSSSANSILWVNSEYQTPLIYNYDTSSGNISHYENFSYDDGTQASIQYFYGLAEDEDNNIWVATSSGPVYVPKAQRPKYSVLTRYKVPRNDGTSLADYLLDGISIRCIKLDKANRKWMGTATNGVYLISSDNNTQVHHFTTDNSPLLSNTVYDILIDNETGIVYFATDKGLCSYTSDVTDENGNDVDASSVYAYPNPVTPDFTGEITIAGVNVGSMVQIVTTSGALVYSSRCNEGSCKWNGCDNSGKKVCSGVYPVITVSPSGKSTLATKIAIVR